jgi:hypothetical protein
MPESAVDIPAACHVKPESEDLIICPEVLRATSLVPSLLDFKTADVS